MKALTINQFGGPEELRIQEVAMPSPGTDEVLVRIHASAVNPVDYKLRNGSLKMISGKKFPRILGCDISGIVEQAPKKSLYRPGDKVFAMLSIKGGGYAEFVAIKDDKLCLIPENISMTEAAAVPLASLTALQAFKKQGGINSGDKLLINGASGGVGTFAIQIGKADGASVTGVCSNKNMEFVKNMGADHVIDYNREDFTKLNQKYNKILDAVAKSSFNRCRKILEKGGSYISTIPDKGLLFYRALNFLRSKKAGFVMVKPSGRDLMLIAHYLKSGLLYPHVYKIFPLRDGAEAHKLIETERVIGKIVLSVIS